MLQANFPNEDSLVLISGGVESSILLQAVKAHVSARVAAMYLNRLCMSCQKRKAVFKAVAGKDKTRYLKSWPETATSLNDNVI